MRTFRLKKCKRIAGLSFTPDGQLLALCGIEAHGIETAVWLDLATGAPTRTLSFVAESFLIAADRSRLILGAHAYAPSDLGNCVRWLDLREESGDWNKVKIGAGWPGRTSAVVPQALALTPDGGRLMVSFGRQRLTQGGVSAEWSDHLAVCPLDSP